MALPYLDARFGRALWTRALDARFGRALWTRALDARFGRALWTRALDARFGRALWTRALDARFGRALWTRALDARFGRALWTRALDARQRARAGKVPALAGAAKMVRQAEAALPTSGVRPFRRRLAGARRRLLEVEVGGVEFAGRAEPVPILDDDFSGLRLDEAVVPQLLQGPVHVHGREPKRVAELGLGERPPEGMAVHEADGAELRVQLAEQMRDAGVGFPAAEACHPLPEDRGIDERVAPEEIADARVGADEGPHRLVRDERHLARDDRAQAVVHDVEVNALQVADVARDMEREDLPLAAFDDLVAAGEAFENQAALRRPILVSHDVLIGLEVPQHHRQGDDGLPLLVGKRRYALELADERMERVGGGCVHVASCCFGAGARTRLSAIGARVSRPMMQGPCALCERESS